ncbi:hypothetical protein U1Q18_027894, partial [Sarracenia purpurea var. burkii]
MARGEHRLSTHHRKALQPHVEITRRISKQHRPVQEAIYTRYDMMRTIASLGQKCLLKWKFYL